IDTAALVRWELLDAVPGDVGARRVGAVGRIRDQDHLTRIAAFAVVGAHHHDPRKLSVRPRGRLKGETVHAADGAQRPLQVVHQAQASLGGPRGELRVRAGEPGKPYDLFVDL